MLHLYLGYLSVQLYSFIALLHDSSYPFSVYIFSILVCLIFSFIPVLGYFLAKKVGAKGLTNHWVLLLSGFAAGLMEKMLYHFNILTFTDDNTGSIVMFVLLFLFAFVPGLKSNLEQNRQASHG